MGIYLLKNGKIITSSYQGVFSLVIKDKKIEAIGKFSNLKKLYPKAKVIDLEGKFIFPGGIDIHTHFGLEMVDTRTGDDFYTGTQAAALGGITLVVDFAPTYQGSFREGIVKRKEEAKDSIIDYSFHLMLTQKDDFSLFKEEFPGLVKEGIVTLKMFSAYKSRGLYADDYLMYQTLKFIKDLSPYTRVLLHAENNDLVDNFTANLVKKGNTTSDYFPFSRPTICELESVNKFCLLVSETKSRGYIVHLSSGKSAQIIREYQRKGVDIKTETSIYYLFSDYSLNKRENGYLYTMCPPLRSSEESQLLRKHFQNGTIGVLSTDHCAFYRHQKEKHKSNFTALPFGMGGVEISYPYLLDKVLTSNFISFPQFAAVTSANPARLLGLYPQYGEILPGSMANLTIVSPDGETEIDPTTFKMGTDYSPFAGEKLKGKIEYLFSRGEILVKSGKLLADFRGRGKFLSEIKK